MFIKVFMKCLSLGLGLARISSGEGQFAGQDDFGGQYKWAVSLEDGLQKAKASEKPAMLIIYNDKCHICDTFKENFATSKEIQSLSENFQMIRFIEMKKMDKQYSPDGEYVPRILFVSPEGKVMKEFINEVRPDKHSYFYTDSKDITRTMMKVMEVYKKSVKKLIIC